MEPNLRTTTASSPWWTIVVLLSVSTLTQSRLVQNTSPTWTPSYTQQQQQQSPVMGVTVRRLEMRVTGLEMMGLEMRVTGLEMMGLEMRVRPLEMRGTGLELRMLELRLRRLEMRGTGLELRVLELRLRRLEMRLGARPRPVVLRCHPDSMEVVVQADLFDTGLQVDGRHLRLGSEPAAEYSACSAAPSGKAEFTIWAHLMDCGTKLSSTKEKIIYSTILVYSPETPPDGLHRLDGATIPVECHYEKRYALDGISLQPTWIPLVSTTSAEDHIAFNLRIMTEDWQFERASYSYFLGDPIHFEVSAIPGNHVPLRVYVDQCVATATLDAEAKIKYGFVERYGCLTDAYLTNSSSHFLPRAKEHQLRFQLDAFKFYQEPRNQVYITCYVKAVPVTSTVSAQNRACSLIENRWRSVDGNDQECRSCDISHRIEEPPLTEAPDAIGWSNMIPQEGSVQNRPGQPPATYMHLRPHDKPHQSSARLMKRGTEQKAEGTLQLGPLTVLPSRKYVSSPTNSRTVLSLNKTT
ncbi:zona pellucida sperm-binding protein 3-like [Platichthys flesus]|uniref:zona pellucida sperm-binding protein 3-like n=1 Tax=Platichthys flesus TaxID=8260 RepID=UPI002DB58A06|nr:zona pellucida sperm-binding protein 3-like [Platichthys flesus]